MQVTIIKTDGLEEIQELTLEGVHKAIGAETLDIVNLHDGRVMAVDDLGYETKAVEHRPGFFELVPTKARKPVNAKATTLSLSLQTRHNPSDRG